MARRSSGEGSVFKRTGKSAKSSWVAEQRVKLPDGSLKVITGYGATQKEAKLERTRKVKEVMAAAESRTTWTVARYLGYFLEQCEARVKANTMSIRTYETYESDIRVNIVPHLGKVPLSRLEPHHVQDWVTKLLGEKSAASTRKARATLNAAMTSALDWGLLERNPVPNGAALSSARKTSPSGARRRRRGFRSRLPSSALRTLLPGD